MNNFDINKIIIEEISDYTVNTEEGDEGVGVRLSYLKDGERKEIYDIDGIRPEDMKNIRAGIIKLLKFIESKSEVLIIVKIVKKQENGIEYTNCPVCERKIILSENWRKQSDLYGVCDITCECLYTFKVKPEGI